MTPADRLTSELRTRATGRSRVGIEHVWSVFTELRPDDARAADARRRLADLIQQAAAERLLTPSVSTDRLFPVPLPRFVDLVRAAPPGGTARRAPWMTKLAWATHLRLTPLQLDVLDCVNGWLRDGGPTRPVVPAEERSIELFDDEKAIVNRIGGANTLWAPGRLGPDLLRYENVPIPFPYRRVGAGSRVLMVENTAAFRTCSRLLAADGAHPYFAVAFGQGAWAPKTVPAALELPRPIDAVDYWGDLDPKGLAIAHEVVDVAATFGLTGLAHPTLWRLMLSEEPVHHPKAPRSFDPSVLNVLPANLRPRAEEVLSARKRIPQERLGYERLGSIEKWWDPEPVR
jgi:Wadjet protein JetD, C-terminal